MTKFSKPFLILSAAFFSALSLGIAEIRTAMQTGSGDGFAKEFLNAPELKDEKAQSDYVASWIKKFKELSDRSSDQGYRAVVAIQKYFDSSVVLNGARAERDGGGRLVVSAPTLKQKLSVQFIESLGENSYPFLSKAYDRALTEGLLKEDVLFAMARSGDAGHRFAMAKIPQLPRADGDALLARLGDLGYSDFKAKYSIKRSMTDSEQKESASAFRIFQKNTVAYKKYLLDAARGDRRMEFQMKGLEFFPKEALRDLSKSASMFGLSNHVKEWIKGEVNELRSHAVRELLIDSMVAEKRGEPLAVVQERHKNRVQELASVDPEFVSYFKELMNSDTGVSQDPKAEPHDTAFLQRIGKLLSINDFHFLLQKRDLMVQSLDFVGVEAELAHKNRNQKTVELMANVEKIGSVNCSE